MLTRATLLVLSLSLAACGRGETCVREQPGVMLSFDDFDWTWEAHLPLLAEHAARVTFYPKGEWLRDPAETAARLLPLAEGGHAFGVHTIEHERAAREWLLHEERWLEDDVLVAKATLERVLERPVRSFAYPRGEHTSLTDRAIFPHFDHLRGFREEHRSYWDGQLRQTPRFFFSTSIDTRWERDEAYFEEHLDALAATRCEVWPITSHGIDDDRWGITPERLAWLLGAIRARGLAFYVPDDFLDPGPLEP
ncbi:MAG: polysaccharide deacetylase family protein [Deltaproteobacteria bacterium]|nr:polysaccharide deacetylase family protein [Deltaproteobacteria bacterium]